MQTVKSCLCAGLDIGCGANCIYPLLGAAINGWRFVGIDVTQLALDQAAHNVTLNPHLAHLITVRPSNSCNAAQPPHAVASSQAGQQLQPRAAPAVERKASGSCNAALALGCGHAGQQRDPAAAPLASNTVSGGAGMAALADPQGSGLHSIAGAAEGKLLKKSRVERQPAGAGDIGQQTATERSAGSSRQSAPSPGPASDAGSTDGILLPALLPGEIFSFSMCNPPFFSSMAETGLNPSTAYGGGHRTASETVQHVISGASRSLLPARPTSPEVDTALCFNLETPVVLPCCSSLTALPHLTAGDADMSQRQASKPMDPAQLQHHQWLPSPAGTAGIAAIGCMHCHWHCQWLHVCAA